MSGDDEERWQDVKARLPVGTVVEGTVVHVARFGVFIELGVGFPGLLRVPEMAGSGPKTMDDYPRVGESVTARVLHHSDGNRQVVLIQKDITTGPS